MLQSFTTENTISILSLLGIGAIVGAWVNHRFQKNREKTARSIQSKMEAYSSLLNFASGFLGDPNLDYEEALKYQREFIKKFHNDILLFSPSSVIRAADNFFDSVSISYSNKDESTDALFGLIAAMRKDLGNSDLSEVENRYKFYSVNIEDLKKKKETLNQ